MKKDLLKQRKRLLIYMITAMMGTTQLMGCSNKLEYEQDNNGIITVTGTINYDEVKTLKLVRLTNEIAGIDKYYLVTQEQYSWNGDYCYIDVETNKYIYRR